MDFLTILEISGIFQGVKNLTVRVEEGVLAAFRARCKERGRHMEFIVGNLLVLWTASPEHLNDAARAAKEFGRVAYSGKPADREELEVMQEQGVSLEVVRAQDAFTSANQLGIAMDEAMGWGETDSAALDASQARSLAHKGAAMRASAATAPPQITDVAPTNDEPASELLEENLQPKMFEDFL
jgi:hypothetical protein